MTNLQYQIGGWRWLPWYGPVSNKEQGYIITSHYFGWMCFQFCLTTAKEQNND